MLGRQADWRQALCSVVGLIGRHAVKARVRAAAIVQRDEGTPHRTEERQVLYAWHPSFGGLVHIHEVIQKTAGDVFRCSCDDEASGRWLELPAWMFDRSVCAPMQVCASPFVGVTALGALRALLSDLAGNRAGIIGGSSNAPVPGAALVSHGQNQSNPCNGRTSVIISIEAPASSSICSGWPAATAHDNRPHGRRSRHRPVRR